MRNNDSEKLKLKITKTFLDRRYFQKRSQCIQNPIPHQPKLSSSIHRPVHPRSGKSGNRQIQNLRDRVAKRFQTGFNIVSELLTFMKTRKNNVLDSINVFWIGEILSQHHHIIPIPLIGKCVQRSGGIITILPCEP